MNLSTEALRGLYALVDPEHCGGRDPLEVTEAILRGGVAIVQLRAKRMGDAEHVALGRAMAHRCHAAGVPFVINDRADIARIVGADGLHLGQDDLPIADARRIFDGPIGLSTHDVTQARAAERVADIVAFGPIFDTSSKALADPTVGLAALREVAAVVTRPLVAIGGISLARTTAVREAGAALVACIGAVAGADDPEAAARAMHRAALG